MYCAKDLSEEIRQKIERMRSMNDSVLNPDWIANAILKDHSGIEGNDEPFYQFNARAHVRNEVRKHLNQFKISPDEETDRQLVLPGFTHVQQYYFVTRGGKQCVIHVSCLTIEEYQSKLRELYAIAEGCKEHALELERYWKNKQAAVQS